MTTVKSVDEYLLKHPERKEELTLLRRLLLTLPIEETIKWGAPVYTVNGKNVVGLGAFKAYVGLWFYQGVFLTDKHKVLVNAQEEKTRAMRQWRFNSIDEINSEQILEYTEEAIKNQLDGKEIKPVKSGFEMPLELLIYLNQNDLEPCFEGLTSYKQKEYCEYIDTAKRAETKQQRLEKIKLLILDGKGLNDKYR